MRFKNFVLATVMGAAFALPAMAQTPTTPATPVPSKPAMTMPTTTKPTMGTMAPAAAMTPVNINTATAKQLDALPGIGKARAKKIVDGRPYKSVDELDSKKVIPHSVFEKLKDKVTV